MRGRDTGARLRSFSLKPAPPLSRYRDPAEFGYSAPRITCEYDRATGFLLSVYIEYNRRAARRNQALTGAEVRNKVCEDMIKAAFFEDTGYTFKEDIILAGAEDLRAFSVTKV